MIIQALRDLGGSASPAIEEKLLKMSIKDEEVNAHEAKIT